MKRRGKAIKLRAKVARRVAAPKVRPARPPAKARPAPVPDLQRELNAALEQLAATSEVLRIIADSGGALEPVFAAVLRNATRICEAKFGNLWLREGDKFRIVSNYGGSREYRDFLLRNSLTVPDPRTIMGRVINTRKAAQIEDIRKAPTYGMKARLATIKIAKARTLVAVPMLKDDEVIGAIGIYRQEIRPFTDKQVALLTTFAAQAVIAIENTRLLTELRQRTTDLTESLEQQTATSEVLQVISSSPGDLGPVFAATLENAVRISGAKFGIIHGWDGENLRLMATHNLPPAFDKARRGAPVFKPGPKTGIRRMAATRRVIHIRDLLEDEGYLEDRAPQVVAAVELGGVRTMLAVPMLKENEVVGAFTVYRQEVRPFTDKQIDLVKNFAAQAVIAIENARLLGELRQRTTDLTESLEQQTATSEVLRVISSSAGDLEPVFRTVLGNASRICEANFGILSLREGDASRVVALHNAPPAFAELRRREPVIRVGPLALLAATKRWVQIPDLTEQPAYKRGDRDVAAFIKLTGARTLLAVPMLKDDELIGAIAVYRTEVRTFTDKQIELMQSFAAQAVIAIENARLLGELRESLEQQTAMSDVLRVISSTPGELEPVFHAMLESATRICEAKFGLLFRYDGDMLEFVADMGTSPALAEFVRKRGPFRPNPNTLLARVIGTKKVSETQDYAADAPNSPPVKFGGARSTVDVPLLKDGELVGALSIYRQEVRPFTDKQIALVENFAAQAVIAIENARLLSELRESLERQTATSEVLGVISRSKFELQPILQSVVETAERLCHAEQTVIYRLQDGVYRFAAGHSAVAAYLELERNTVISPGPGTVVGRAAMTCQIARIDDAWNDPLYENKDDAKVGGVRSMIGVPLMRDGEPIGVIGLARCRVEPFSDREIELVKTFADQAVIAIENVRLFEAEQQRTRELTESLEQQTATSEVLSVISSSPGDLQPVFDRLLTNATRLCEANFGLLVLYQGDGRFRVVAMHNAPPAFAKLRQREPEFYASPKTGLGRTAATKEVVHIADYAEEEAYKRRDPAAVALGELGGARTFLVVPMLKDNEMVGAIAIYRQQVRPFSDKQIALVANFAAQAVIAIENTRLLNELRQRTTDLTESLEQQTATSEVLQVISSSPGELQPVFHAMLQNAARVCDAKFGMLFRLDDGAIRPVASVGVPAPLMEYFESGPRLPSEDAPIMRAAATKGPVHVVDFANERPYQMRNPLAVAAVERFGVRTLLVVPLLKEGEFIGAFAIFRQEVRPFTEKQIELLQNFASQAVIAIENTRLLTELRQRTADLTESLEQQTATSEVLRVISSSPGDLEPVFQAMLD